MICVEVQQYNLCPYLDRNSETQTQVALAALHLASLGTQPPQKIYAPLQVLSQVQ